MGYIFESEIESILHTVRARTIAEADSILLKEVLAAPIHPAIKAYFRAEVENLLQQERKKEVRSKKFPYSLPEVLRLQEHIDLLLVHHYSFDRREFDTLLDQAVHFQFNYLCRPQFTLLGYLFENRRRIPTADIERKLRTCVDYAYYAEIVKRYIADRGLVEISYEEFQRLIQKIDREVVARHSSVELARLLKALCTFVAAGVPHASATHDSASLPINAAIVFFEDKNLDDIRKRLEQERDSRGIETLTLDHLANLIEKVRKKDETAEVVALPEPEKVRAEEQVEQKEPQAVSSPAEVPLAAEPSESPLVPEFIVVEPAQSAPPVPEAKAAPPQKPTAAEAVPEGIHTIFTPQQRKYFVKRIFKRDEVSFRDALDTINLIPSWEDASHYLDELFVALDVDPFSEEAIALTEKIYAWYHPDDATLK